MAEVTLHDVRKSFGATQVIKGVDLSIPHGSFVVFVGPSGCGKSTLLRLIAGLENVSSGDIRIGGDVVTRAEPYDRGIAMVFQSYALYPHMTVAENMGFALMLQGASVEARRDAVGKAAKILQIIHLLDRKPAQLSGGQRQRVAIGRAIVRQPKVFLFDEPLSNLDAELRAQTRIEIARLHKSLGATMIYVTHDQVEAMTLADQIVVLRDGLIEQTGSPTELYDNPDNSFVAGFIGSPKMNLFDARVLDGNRAEVGGYQLPLPKLETALAPGAPIQLGIRPEAFSGSSGREIEVEVDVVEMLGSESLVHAWLAPDIPIVVEVRGSRPSAGDRMAIRLDPGRMLVFHATHGRRLR